MITIPEALKPKSSIYDLKKRLDWGEPALTIIDVRDRKDFNDCHIMGAISCPVGELIDRARASLETDRDVYVYGVTDEEAAQSATLLQKAGYTSVAELVGGLDAWKAVGFPVEGALA
ncbi:MAG: rhodanese-like domain-containing protein [Prochlorotrichaceae cyanobacterium]|jgi:rhodanese-related sulfurtransferase